MAMTTDTDIWDCIVIGGGAAGLSAALSLGRARRRTLLVDAGRQSNLAAHGIGGLLGHDRRPPAELYVTGRAELAEYATVEIRDGEVIAAEPQDDAFAVTLADGAVVQGRRMLLATGMDYRHPDVLGMAQRWGETVFHCPFCHGWEVRERPLAVFGGTPIAVHQALLLTAWSDDVTLLTGGTGDIDAPERERLAGAGVGVDERPVAELLGPGASLEAVRFADGEKRVCRGILVATTLHQRSDLPKQLGAAYAPGDPLSAEAIEVDGQYQTSVPGVYAAGDIVAGPPAVARAVAAGNFAGAMIVMGLTTDAAPVAR